MTHIYHITPQVDWVQAQSEGAYQTESLKTQGFIHFSTREQTTKVADSIYQGRQDLLLLVVAVDQLAAPLKWEAPHHPNPDAPPPTTESETFPHLYGALNLDAVLEVLDFLPNEDGSFNLPESLR